MPRRASAGPPRSDESERLLIGGALLWRGPVIKACAALDPADFYDRDLGAIWSAVSAVWRRGEAVGLPTVAYELDQRGDLDRVGAEPRLVELQHDWQVALVGEVGFYEACARIIHDYAERRRVVASAAELARAASAGDIDRAKAGISKLVRKGRWMR